MRNLMLGLCGGLPLMLGATSFTVNDSDMVYVTGPGPVEVVNGTLLYSNMSEHDSPWAALYTRNAGEQNIVLQASTGGTYQLKSWSIPSDQMNPQRQSSTSTMVVDGADIGPFDTSSLLMLLAAWGACPVMGACEFDFNNDGVVDVSDLQMLLANWD